MRPPFLGRRQDRVDAYRRWPTPPFDFNHEIMTMNADGTGPSGFSGNRA